MTEPHAAAQEALADTMMDAADRERISLALEALASELSAALDREATKDATIADASRLLDEYRGWLAEALDREAKLREALREGWTLAENYPLSGKIGPQRAWDAFAKTAMQLVSPEFAAALASMPETTTQMDEWVRLFASRDEMAVEYAALLAVNGPTWKSWPTLNLAIMDRWSRSGLLYIKRKAWTLASEPKEETT